MPSMPFMISDLALDVAERLSRISCKTRSAQSAPGLATAQNKSPEHTYGAFSDVCNFLRCHPRLALPSDDAPIATTEEPRLGRQAKTAQNPGLLPTSAPIEAIESKPIFTCNIEIILTPATPIDESDNPFLADHIQEADKQGRLRQRAVLAIDAARLHAHWRSRASILEEDEMLQREVGYYSDDEGDVLEWPASWDEGSEDPFSSEEEDLLDQLDALSMFPSNPPPYPSLACYCPFPRICKAAYLMLESESDRPYAYRSKSNPGSLASPRQEQHFAKDAAVLGMRTKKAKAKAKAKLWRRAQEAIGILVREQERSLERLCDIHFDLDLALHTINDASPHAQFLLGGARHHGLSVPEEVEVPSEGNIVSAPPLMLEGAPKSPGLTRTLSPSLGQDQK
ncbi:hypothetical protein FIBSPDRAFT_932411 [Athelia psychrophila]|uniref:Uncharacterized protein n=1 Tax=Athelia psychrophila TaxID=1759441 RepID=A0A166IT86_9AGAM|nr:hypothetical protein FIBSPDRAFT_932411 [Fibularhizoctonia sp. CBS 109695]